MRGECGMRSQKRDRFVESILGPYFGRALRFWLAASRLFLQGDRVVALSRADLAILEQ
jgi:hypothetical protein